ncbi:sigma-70 family RNA polymerase sigma factor [Gemmata sp. JC673]|uniref:Sigma-70 family RNA polymerase sigma factor n=1 Tax=Gemmata algarum TaxID=2975278 RepID=A0ABU5FCZ3_9BACT|nr:sigma-70 family RNA polymerase sigma factor [Gemmata algarum]MDY3563681.1 sigma-70 family RNA polymerase sigma factor [Gemmata algarum]
MTPFTDLAAPFKHVPDAELLGRFVREGDRAVFELLVRRHWRFVHGVCRRVAGDAHDAEDAAQATFLVLARRAELVRGACLGPWLARVAYRCAIRARAARPPTFGGDLSAAPGRDSAASDPELSAALDAELNDLPDKYRVPVVLCYLQGKTYEQAAAELNCPIGTLSTWLTRAKELLRARLTRRGLAPGGLAALLDGLNAQASDCVFRFLTETAVFAAGEVPRGRAAAVATGVIHAMDWKSRLLPTLSALIAVLGLAAAAASLEPPPKPAPAERPVVANTDADKLQGVWVFDSAHRGKGDALGMVWPSRVTIRGDAVTVEPFLDEKLSLKGKIRIGPSGQPKQFPLALDELDITPAGAPAKVAAGEYAGVYQLEGDRLTVCLAAENGGPRPTTLDTDGERTIRARLVKAPVGFKELPKEFTVKAVGADGQPVSGALVAEFMDRIPPRVPFSSEWKPIPPEKWTVEQRNAVEKDRAEREKEKPADGVVRDKATGLELCRRTADRRRRHREGVVLRSAVERRTRARSGGQADGDRSGFTGGACGW